MSHQARPGGAAGRRPGLHGLPPGAHRAGGLAAQRLADARPQAVLRGHVLRARGPAGAGRVPDGPQGDRAGLEGGPGEARRRGRARRRTRSGSARRRSAAPAAGAPRRARRGGGRRLREGLPVLRRELRPRARRLRRARPSSRGRRTSRSCCGARRSRAPGARRGARRPGWSRGPSARWPAAGSTTTSAAGSTATRWTTSGSCRTSRRCSTTRRRSPSCALEAWQATGDERHAWLARDILDYVLRDMTGPEGGFYSAEDADSPAQDGAGPAEGAFYVWTPGRGGARARRGRRVRGGPLRDEGRRATSRPRGIPTGMFSGRNILAQARPLGETARRHGLEPQAASDLLVSCLGRLLAARSARRRPHLDDKVVAGWNGLMISALARAAVAPAESLRDRRADYLAAALRGPRRSRGASSSTCPAGCRAGPGAAGRGRGPGSRRTAPSSSRRGSTSTRRRSTRAGSSAREALQRAMDEQFWDADEGRLLQLGRRGRRTSSCGSRRTTTGRSPRRARRPR